MNANPKISLDGTSFPFLYVGLFAAINDSAGAAVKNWFIDTILWQCLLGTLIGVTIGFCANRTLRFAHGSDFMSSSFFFVFYFLLALFCVGVASTLGVDDFLVAFGAGTGFAWGMWISEFFCSFKKN